MADKLTPAERLRVLITGQVARIESLRTELKEANTKIDDLKAELAPFRAIAAEFAPEPEAEPGDGTLDAAA